MNDSPITSELKTHLSTKYRIKLSKKSKFKPSTFDQSNPYALRKAMEILKQEIEAKTNLTQKSASESEEFQKEYWRPSWRISDMYKDVEDEDLVPRVYNRRLLIDYTVSTLNKR